MCLYSIKVWKEYYQAIPLISYNSINGDKILLEEDLAETDQEQNYCVTEHLIRGEQ